MLFRHAPCHLIEISAHQHQRMLLQHFAPRGFLFHHFVQMLQKSPVAAAHVANSLPLPHTFIPRFTSSSTPLSSTLGPRAFPNSKVGSALNIGKYETVTPYDVAICAA